MSAFLDALSAWGCDVQGAMERMADDEDFYAECLQEVSDDPYFDRLKDALTKGDVRAAFDAAHTLKGVLANVGLTPMYNKIVEIVEPLRAGRGAGLDAQFSELLQMRAKLNAILSNH